VPIFILLIIATSLEVSGDALVRLSIFHPGGMIRWALLLAGALLLLGYGVFLNVAPVDFGRVVGLYVGTLFIVWQIINFIVFKSLPGMPVLLGGLLIIAGGAIVTFWRS
jgi:small multidrug resistance family-3 protein